MELQKESCQKMCFFKKVKTQQNTKSNIKILVCDSPDRKSNPGIEPGTSRTSVGCIISGPPNQQKISIVVKLFKCFNAMGRNVYKQS